MEPFRFSPLLFERVWGGHALERDFGRIIPDHEKTYGESWEVCDRPDANSIIAEGPLKGYSLHDIWTTRRNEIFGEGYDSQERFPLLCKIIDANEHLSIQVHPGGKTARLTEGEAKNEIWYIASSTPDSLIYAGIKEETTAQNIHNTINNNTLENLLNSYHLNKGDSFYIPAGTVHAIGKGNIIYEIQQNSDTTFRLYDWGREPKRQLHIEESLSIIENEQPGPISPRLSSSGKVISTPYFEIEDAELFSGQLVPITHPERFAIVVIIEGAIELPSGTSKQGDFILFPARSRKIQVNNHVRLLVVQCPPSATSI